MTHRKLRSYDHRIKAQIVATGDPNLFPELEIPRSTAMSWIRRGMGEVVALFLVGGASGLTLRLREHGDIESAATRARANRRDAMRPRKLAGRLSQPEWIIADHERL